MSRQFTSIDFARVFEGYALAFDEKAPNLEQWRALVEQFQRIVELKPPAVHREPEHHDEPQLFRDEDTEIVFTPSAALLAHLDKYDED